MDFDPRNPAARTKRAGYPATNSFTIHELHGLPPLFDWVDCASGHSNFKMLLGGRDFTDFLAAYILHYEELGTPKWFDDQFNMVSAKFWFQRNVRSMSIKDCPKHMMDWTGTRRPECLIWHAKGDLKR